jgi:iron complex outermembrane recepter protein
MFLGGVQGAQASEVRVPAQLLSQSLTDVAHQTGTNILFAPERVIGIRAAAVEGSMSAEEAVRRLLAGTNLQVVEDGNGGLIVRQPWSEPVSVPPAGNASENVAVETVIVTGIRGSLKRDLDIKRNAFGNVDVITKEDTGKFPDANLGTALMRLPGVTVNRNVTSLNGINTTTGEPTEITVRGFGPTFNETLFDGRKVPSGLSSRGFDFSTLNSDLVSEVDVLKSPDPTLSDGAIGATIDIKYPKPIDDPGLRLAISGSTTFSPEEGKFTPNGIFLFSDTFAHDSIGILLAGSYAETKSRSNEVSVWGWEGTYLDPCQFAGAAGSCSDTLAADTSRAVWFPQAYGVYQIHNWQMRENLIAAVQWQPADALLVTLNANYYRSDLKEKQSGIALWNNANEMRNATAADDGTITGFVRYNTPTDFDSQYNEQVIQSYDVGLRVNWRVTNAISIVADADMALSALNPGGQFGEYSVDVGYGPSTSTGINGNDTGVIIATGGGHTLPYFTSYGPGGDASQFLNSEIIGSHVIVLMSQRNRNIVNQAKLQGTLEREQLSITGGFQYQANHIKLANYQNFANNQWQAFSGYGPASNNYYTSGPDAGLPAGVALPASLFTQSFSTKNFIPGWNGSNALPDRILVFDPKAVVEYLESLGDPVSPTTVPGFNWGCCTPAYDGKLQVVFDPANYQHIYEDSYAGYLSAVREAGIFGMPYKLRIGLRYDYTDTMSAGIGQQPDALTVMPSDHTAFLVSYGTAAKVAKSSNYSYLLPSLDLNLGVTDDMSVRIDASRTMTRPPLGYLTPVLNLTSSERVGSLVANGGNPHLKPYLSDNVGMSLEWYYAANSMLSVDAFLKNVSDFIVSGTTFQTINNVIDPTTGQPARFSVSSYVNGPSASVYGVELALQHMFGDTGFGLQANGTIVRSNRPYDASDLTTSGFAITGLADSANLIAFYDKNGFQLRIAANWRDSYLDRFGQQQNYSAFGAEPTFVNASWNVDLSTSYEIRDRLVVYGEVMNLIDANYGTRGRFYEQVLDVVAYGRRVTIGIRYTH